MEMNTRTGKFRLWNENSRISCEGFTLIEILVVVAILGVVMSMMLPTVNLARTKMKISSSMNNLRVIGTIVWDYHQNSDGDGGPRTNGGYWKSPPDGNPYNHYWGAMYGSGKEYKLLFHSPMTHYTLEENSDGPRANGHQYVDYAFNGVASLWYDEVACFSDTRRRTGRDIDTYLFPAQTIWAQDHSEPMMDGNGDVPCYAFAHDRNAFNHAHPDFNPGARHRANSEVALYEIFRNRGMSGVLWADGHTSKLGVDHVWKPSWYTGGRKDAQQAWEERENGRFTEPPPYKYTFTGRL